MEELMQVLWASALRLDRTVIGVDDNFFTIGGDSISAIQLSSAARKAGLSLTVSDLYQLKTLAAIAAFLENDKAGLIPERALAPFDLFNSSGSEALLKDVQNAADQCSVNVRCVQDLYPTMPLQDGLFALSMREPGSYVNQRVFRFSPSIDAGRFKLAWEEVLASTEILRTRIVHYADRGNFQAVLEPCSAWSDYTSPQESLRDYKAQPLGYGLPLCYYGLVGNRSDDGFLFVLTCHHVLYDG